MHIGLHLRCSLFFYSFNRNWNVFTNFGKTPGYQIKLNLLEFLKLFYVYRQVDRVSSFVRCSVGM
jgi:hypothetical protein